MAEGVVALPTELWTPILTLALDALETEPLAVFARQRLAVILSHVCTTWRDIVKQIQGRTILLRSVVEIHALVRSISRDPSQYGEIDTLAVQLYNLLPDLRDCHEDIARRASALLRDLKYLKLPNIRSLALHYGTIPYQYQAGINQHSAPGHVLPAVIFDLPCLTRLRSLVLSGPLWPDRELIKVIVACRQTLRHLEWSGNDSSYVSESRFRANQGPTLTSLVCTEMSAPLLNWLTSTGEPGTLDLHLPTSDWPSRSSSFGAATGERIWRLRVNHLSIGPDLAFVNCPHLTQVSCSAFALDTNLNRSCLDVLRTALAHLPALVQLHLGHIATSYADDHRTESHTERLVTLIKALPPSVKRLSLRWSTVWQEELISRTCRQASLRMRLHIGATHLYM